MSPLREGFPDDSGEFAGNQNFHFQSCLEGKKFPSPIKEEGN